MKLALVLNDDFSLWRFWGGLIRALKARSVDVYAVTPAGPYVPRLVNLGAKHVAVDMARFVNPFSDFLICWSLYRLFRREKIDLVCNITTKPIIYGTLAASLVGVPRIVGMVEGLGYAFTESSTWSAGLVRWGVSILYWLACHLSDRVGFANHDDLAYFVDAGFLRREKGTAFRSMIGINLQEYRDDKSDTGAVATLRHDLELPKPYCLVTMIVARAVWSKGVREFVEASESAAEWPVPVRFLLVGPLDPKARDAVPESYLRNRITGVFRWIGFREDVKSILTMTDVVVLPSFYREGVPRVLLEALAMGKPIVTTKHVGCREVVDEGKNGFLVPIHDSVSLAKAIRALVEDRALRESFGRHSRGKAEAEFDQSVIVQRIISELYGMRDC